jgi:hypothetical protein
MKQFLFILICALLPATAAGQCTSSQARPPWMNGFFQEENNSYIEVVSADGRDETDARNKAATIAIERRNLSTGQRVQVTVRNGVVEVNGSDELTVKSRILDEYREQCGYGQARVSLLMQTAKNPTFEFERVDVTDHYGVSPRVLVPGLAQLYKGSKTKGTLFIAGEAAFIGGIIATENLRANYIKKTGETHNAAHIKTYAEKADNMKNIRNICIGGAVALYVWNVIDGITATGKKRVLVLSNNNLQITPFAVPNLNNGAAGGMILSFNF